MVHWGLMRQKKERKEEMVVYLVKETNERAPHYAVLFPSGVRHKLTHPLHIST
jgi:hypothetical protein